LEEPGPRALIKAGNARGGRDDHWPYSTFTVPVSVHGCQHVTPFGFMMTISLYM
jgi:hypothetical protein